MEDIKDVKMLVEELEEPEDPNQTQNNSHTNFLNSTYKQGSLVCLTQKFLSLVHEGNGVVDLNFAAVALGVPKRRIYDITNVLEGIGLLTKQGPLSKVYWKGELDVSPEERARLDKVRAVNNQLKEKEEHLDKLLEIARKNNQVVFKNPAHQPYSFVSRDDLTEALPGQTIFAVQKDENTELDKTPDTLNLFLDTGSILDVRILTDNGFCMELIDSDDSDSSTVHVSKRRKLEDKSSEKSSEKSKDKSSDSDDEGFAAEKIFQKPAYKERTFFDPNVDTSRSPIVPISCPVYDPSMDSDEGLCDLFDITI